MVEWLMSVGPYSNAGLMLLLDLIVIHNNLERKQNQDQGLKMKIGFR